MNKMKIGILKKVENRQVLNNFNFSMFSKVQRVRGENERRHTINFVGDAQNQLGDILKFKDHDQNQIKEIMKCVFKVN